MEKFYYITSDGSDMVIDDFSAYVDWLEKKEMHFVFEKWFDESDFSSPEAYAYIKLQPRNWTVGIGRNFYLAFI